MNTEKFLFEVSGETDLNEPFYSTCCTKSIHDAIELYTKRKFDILNIKVVDSHIESSMSEGILTFERNVK